MSNRHKAAARLRVALPADGPGVAVLVLCGQEILYLGQRGLADVEAGVAVTSRTAFDLASVSKHFTAVVVQLLVERGQIALDADVADLLPEWADYPSGRPLRVTDLLWHTSGLPDYSVIWRGPAAETRLTNDRYLRRVRKRPPEFPAGTQVEYSNTNYILLAALIEAVDGLPFPEFLNRNVFAPLGMTESAVVNDPAHPVANRARGYKRERGVVRSSDYPISLVGHSHLFTTTGDLVRWYRALWSGRIISAASLDLALTPGRLDDGTKHIYGLGWCEDTTGAHPSMGHSGSWYGYATYVRRYPTEDLTVVVLSNDETFATRTFLLRLAEPFLG